MKIDPVLFLDTSFVYALVNTRDQWHTVAVRWQRRLSAEQYKLHTTEFVLLEIANGLSAIRFREQSVKTIQYLAASESVTVTQSSSELFGAGFELYKSRMDKHWGLTDCISFRTMENQGIRCALTTDEDFVQAGFRAILLEDC